MNYRELFKEVKLRPSMYLFEVTYPAAQAFVYGCDVGNAGGLLLGLREWLVLRIGSGSNLAWARLVLDVAFPDAADPVAELRSESGNRHAIDTLFDLVIEFLDVRGKSDGLRLVYERYSEWLRQQEEADEGE